MILFHAVALLLYGGACLGIGALLGIRGYKRHLLARAIQAVRYAPQAPRTGLVAYVREDGPLNVLNPLTGQDMAQPGRPCH